RRNHAHCGKTRRVDRRPVGQGRKPRDIDNRKLLTPSLVLLKTTKAAFWQSPLQRHLAAFIARRCVSARARAFSFMAAACGLSKPGTDSATYALGWTRRTWRRLQFREVHIVLSL